MIPVVILSGKDTKAALPIARKAWDVAFPKWPFWFSFYVFGEEPIEEDLSPWGYEVTGKMVFGDMLLFAATSLSVPFLLLLDDYIPVTILPHVVLMAYGIMHADSGVGQFRLLPCPGPTIPWHASFAFDLMGVIQPSQPYSISLQAAFWTPHALLQVVDDTDSPWDVELKGSERAKTRATKTYVGLKEGAISYENLYRRGKLVQEAYDNCKRRGYV